MKAIKDSTTTLNSYLLAFIVIVALGAGSFVAYHYTAKHYEKQSTQEFVDSQKNLLCQVRIQKGHTGDIKSEYYIIEQSAKDGDCGHFVDYKNIPDDTQTVWLGF